MKIILRIIRRLILLISKFSLDFNPRYLFNKFVRGSAVVDVNGYKMELNLSGDQGISKDLFIFKKREHLTTDYLISNNIIKKGDIILDIGANIGYYALLESVLVGQEGCVYALEPVQKNYAFLKRNIALNNANNIKTFNLAAGSRQGEFEIYVADKGNISSFTKNPEAKYVSKESVEVVTVDDFIKQKNIDPQLIRMDVEGFETEIVKGMKKTLESKPLLLIEIHPNIASVEDLEAMLDTLSANGYTKVVEIKERNELWMNIDGSLKGVLVQLSKWIDGNKYSIGMGAVNVVNIDELRRSISRRGSAFHALLSC